MIIHPKFIFAHMPRCGGNYISKFLLENIDNCERTSIAHTGILDVSNKDKISFCTIRNPFDWYVSWWSYNSKLKVGIVKDLYKDNRDVNFNEFIKYLLTRNSGKTRWFDLEIMSKLDIGLMSFKFIRIIMNRTNLFLDNKPLDINPVDYLLVDHFVKLEDVENNIINLFDKYIFSLNDNQKSNLKLIGKVNTSKHKKYINYYNDESIELIKHKDRIMFELFKYNFGD